MTAQALPQPGPRVVRRVAVAPGAKRLLDVVVASALLVGLSPVLVLLGLLVACSGPGPVLFRQVRVGRGGRTFTVWKFRSMVVDAERHLVELLDHNEHTDGPLFKMRQDPRVTPVGSWMRRFSLDELPQLVNVLNGSMSLVGPRPALPLEVFAFSPAARRRLLVKPGLTGLWQVSGRSDLDWESGVGLDLHYVDHWSIVLDVQILARTVPAVVRRRGAY